MRRSRFLIGVYFLAVLPLTFAQQSVPFDQQVASLMTALLDQMPVESGAKVRIYIQPPVYLAQEAETSHPPFIGSPFAYHLRKACEAALRPPFRLIQQDELSQIWSEVNLAQVIASHDPDFILQRLQSLETEQVALPLDAILLAEYSEGEGVPQQIFANLYLLDVQRKRKYTVVGRLHLTQGQAEEAPARPKGYEHLRHQAEQISHIVRDEMKEANLSEEVLFDLYVTVDRGPGAVYEEGAPLKILVSSAIDCYIAVTNVDALGEVHLLFPNAYERDNFIRTEQGRQIPAPVLKAYDLTIGPPYGIETILVIASRTPFPVETAFQKSKDLKLVPFPRLGRREAEGIIPIREWTKIVVFRDKQKARMAEAQCVFLTIPRPSKGLF